MEIINTILGLLLSFVTSIVNFFTQILPMDPFLNAINNIQFTGDAFQTGFSWVAWFIDLPFITGMVALWLAAVGLWVIVQLGIWGVKRARDIWEMIPFIG